jgi:hypothetical protein
MSDVIIVGADKGGVGKTTVSRALISYLKAKNVQLRAFDSEYPKGVLKRFYPAETEIVDLSKSAGRMEVFDKLSQSPVTLIDVRAGLLSDLLGKLSKIGLLESVQGGALKLTVMHLLGSSIASFREIRETQTVLGQTGSRHILVLNYINDSSFFAWSPEAQEALTAGDGRINIEQLDTAAAEHIDASSLPFEDYIADPDRKYSMVLRGEARGWLKDVYSQFDQVLKLS